MPEERQLELTILSIVQDVHSTAQDYLEAQTMISQLAQRRLSGSDLIAKMGYGE